MSEISGMEEWKVQVHNRYPSKEVEFRPWSNGNLAALRFEGNRANILVGQFNPTTNKGCVYEQSYSR